MKVHNNNNVKSKIRNISYGQISYENLKSVSKLHNNLVFYDSQRVYESISESVEKQMERNYER
jgi:hypothetical protein